MEFCSWGQFKADTWETVAAALLEARMNVVAKAQVAFHMAMPSISASPTKAWAEVERVHSAQFEDTIESPV